MIKEKYWISLKLFLDYFEYTSQTFIKANWKQPLQLQNKSLTAWLPSQRSWCWKRSLGKRQLRRVTKGRSIVVKDVPATEPGIFNMSIYNSDVRRSYNQVLLISYEMWLGFWFFFCHSFMLIKMCFCYIIFYLCLSKNLFLKTIETFFCK